MTARRVVTVAAVAVVAVAAAGLAALVVVSVIAGRDYRRLDGRSSVEDRRRD